MKRSLILSLIALTFGTLSVSAFPSAAHAGLCDQDPPLTGQVLQDCLASEAGADAAYDPAAIQASNDAALQAAAKSTSDLKQKTDDAYDTIMMKIMSLFAWLVGVAAMTLDYAVYYTVVVMGSYIKGISAIGLTWQVLRDIGNIMIIFGFLAIGISIILNTERLGYGKKLLPSLLLAAVFLNFSLFFAEAIIDTGNLFATQFYQQINGGVLPQTLPGSSVLANPDGSGALTPGTEAISNKLMSQLGLQAIYGNASDPTKAQELLKAGSPWYVGFLGILLFIITAFVMFSLAFILIARFVMLIFLIILAPIGFAGLAVPKLSSMAHKWWSQLFEQTITAPVLLLMLYIALRVITDVKFLSGLGVIDASAATGVIGGTNLPGFAGWILSFLVAMGLLIAVTITAKSMSAFGAGVAMKGAGALSFGATAFGMRATVGAGSHYFAQKVRSSKFGATKTGRLFAGGLDKGAKGSFDIRGVKQAGFLGAGDAQKGGYEAREKASIEAHEKYAKTLTGQGPTKQQKEALAKAEAEHTRAKTGQLSINEHEEAVRKVAEHTAEVASLKEELRKDPYLQADPVHAQKLSAAEANLARNQGIVTAALPKATAAAEALKLAKEQEEKVKKDIEETTSTKGAQKAYAENIKTSNPLVRWALFGPGGATAAKKILKEKKNTIDLDEMKKFLEEKDKPKGETKEGKPEEKKDEKH